MRTTKERFEELYSSLKQQRDELALQMHLGKKEAQDEWKKVEAHWTKFLDDAKPFRDAVGETAENVWTSMEMAADEIKKGFLKIRKLL